MGSTTNGALGAIWTKEAIVFAIQRWAHEFGDPPTSKCWNGARRPPGYPSAQTVKEKFGTWNNGIRAAGFQPRPRGALGHLDPEWTVMRLNARCSR